ncbi:MAG: NifU family protein [Psychroflexus sp.]|nr:NifU family protein [Psychroflexus sp.]MDN6309057.1 NifU family protein [Psychroflexus sp.]
MTGKELNDKVEVALEEIRPFLKNDGGNIELLSIDDDKHVRVKLLGACIDCTVNQMTLKSGVEMTIKKHVPQIESVTNVKA